MNVTQGSWMGNQTHMSRDLGYSTQPDIIRDTSAKLQPH